MPTDAALQSAFDAAVAASKSLPERPDNLTLLKLYALYKQATEGELAESRPALDLVARAKWDARKALAGVGADEAMRRYIDLVAELQAG